MGRDCLMGMGSPSGEKKMPQNGIEVGVAHPSNALNATDLYTRKLFGLHYGESYMVCITLRGISPQSKYKTKWEPLWSPGAFVSSPPVRGS